MWAYDSTLYQIYPLGFCGAPFENDGSFMHRILKVNDWIPHLRELQVGAVLFNPVFESDSHGYDTRDYRKIDVRLGTNEDFKDVCRHLHEAGIRVILDGVFNHAGRGFFAFRDVCQRKRESPYKDWFCLNFDGDSDNHDGFWYEGWEGCYQLVKLNLKNPETVSYLLDSVKGWIKEFDIDGIRLDVAYLLDREFLKALKTAVFEAKQDFFLVGEVMNQNDNSILTILDSETNYECYKGIWSSINSKNFFEISYSFNRLFGKDPWCLYRGKHLLSFVDNHDVSRIASVLTDSRNLPVAYAMMFSMPGIPCLYYGSEWGAKGRKEDGDPALRSCFDSPQENELTEVITALSQARNRSDALKNGGYRNVLIKNPQMIFERATAEDCVYALFNLEDAPWTAETGELVGTFTDLISEKEIVTDGSVQVPGHGFLLYEKGIRKWTKTKEGSDKENSEDARK